MVPSFLNRSSMIHYIETIAHSGAAGARMSDAVIG